MTSGHQENEIWAKLIYIAFTPFIIGAWLYAPIALVGILYKAIFN